MQYCTVGKIFRESGLNERRNIRIKERFDWNLMAAGQHEFRTIPQCDSVTTPSVCCAPCSGQGINEWANPAINKLYFELTSYLYIYTVLLLKNSTGCRVVVSCSIHTSPSKYESIHY